jgi:hypothetical protein
LGEFSYLIFTPGGVCPVSGFVVSQSDRQGVLGTPEFCEGLFPQEASSSNAPILKTLNHLYPPSF